MAIVTKNNAVAAAKPVLGDLIQGELALNVVDGLIYTRDALNAVLTLGVIKQGGSANDTTRLNSAGEWESTSALTIDDSGDIDFTGTLTGDGSGLTGVAAATVGGVDALDLIVTVGENESRSTNNLGRIIANENDIATINYERPNGGTVVGEVSYWAYNASVPEASYWETSGTGIVCDGTGFDCSGIVDANNFYINGVDICVGFRRFSSVTQAEYNALTPDNNTIYFIEP